MRKSRGLILFGSFAGRVFCSAKTNYWGGTGAAQMTFLTALHEKTEYEKGIAAAEIHSRNEQQQQIGQEDDEMHDAG
jgi:hypothetical protein